jgi:hypothetical protein
MSGADGLQVDLSKQAKLNPESSGLQVRPAELTSETAPQRTYLEHDHNDKMSNIIENDLHKDTALINNPPKRICGMKSRPFWGILAVALVMIIAVVIAVPITVTRSHHRYVLTFKASDSWLIRIPRRN